MVTSATTGTGQRTVSKSFPYKGDAAFFRVHLEFYNGHECAISGIATASGKRLVYRGPKDGDRPACLFILRQEGGHIFLGDENGSCRQLTCGVRGGYGDGSNSDFALSQRKPIRALHRLRASEDFTEAVRDYENGGR